MGRRATAGTWTAVLAAAVFTVGAAAQSKPAAYPAKGQSEAQQRQDDGQCYGWARSNTGVDPQTAAQAAAPSGSTVGSGHRAAGAVGGAVIGGIANGSDGARAGAAVGIVAGGMRARQVQRSQQASTQSQQQGALDSFNRAYAACMESRGYTVR